MDELDAFMADLAAWNNADTAEVGREIRVVLLAVRPDGVVGYFAGATRRTTDPHGNRPGRYRLAAYGALYIDDTPLDRPFAGGRRWPAGFEWVNGEAGRLTWYDAGGKQREGETTIVDLRLVSGVLVGTGQGPDGPAICTISFQKAAWPGPA